MEFRAQTLKRLEVFSAQRFFRTQDYLNSAPRTLKLQLT